MYSFPLGFLKTLISTYDEKKRDIPKSLLPKLDENLKLQSGVHI